MSAEESPNPREAMTDHELIALVGAGERAALDALVRRHHAKSLGLAYRFLGRWDLAEDAAQDAFVRVWKAAATFQPNAKFTTWLYRLIANQCWDRRRQTQRDLRRRLMQPIQEDHAIPGDPLELRERAARIQAAVADLPDRQRLAIILHRFEGMSHHEIMEVTGWSRAAVESCLVRAYESLRNSLSDLA